MKAHLLNALTLAYMGDAAYETEIRQHLIGSGLTKPNDLHHQATAYVSAKAQADILEAWLDEGRLSPGELAIAKRGRNAKSHTIAKNTDPATYQTSTAFEAVLGALYLQDDRQRFDDLCQAAIHHVQKKQEKEHPHG